MLFFVSSFGDDKFQWDMLTYTLALFDEIEQILQDRLF